MIKKILFVMILTIFFSANVFAADIIVDNQKIDAETIIVDGRALVPVRGVFEKLNFDVNWNDKEKNAVLTKGKTAISIKSVENTFTVNGKSITPDIPQKIVNRRFYLPLRAIVETLPEYNILWNSIEKTVYINSTDIKTTVDTQKKENTNNSESEKKEIEKEPEIMGYRAEMPVVEKNENLKLTIMANDVTDRVKILSGFTSKEIETKNFTEKGGKRVFETEVQMTESGEQELMIYAGNKNGYVKKAHKTVPFIVKKEKMLEEDVKLKIESLEKEVFALVNKERAKEGLSELEWSDELARAAKGHSIDMAENHYFSHTSLDGREFDERIENEGMSMGFGGENIAAGSKTAKDVMEQWMNSPGHRANILQPEFEKIGVGLAFSKDSKYGYYWTQCFAD